MALREIMIGHDGKWGDEIKRVTDDELRDAFAGCLVHSGCMKDQAKALADDLVNFTFKTWGGEKNAED